MLKNTASKIITGIIALACLLGSTQTAMADDATSQATTHTVTYLDWKGDTIATRTVANGADATDIGLADMTWLADPDMNFDNVDGWHDWWWGGTPAFTKDGLVVNSRDTRAKGRTVSANATIHVEADADYSKANVVDSSNASGIGFNVNDDYRRYAGWHVCAKGDADCRVDDYFNAGNTASENIEPWVQIDNMKDYGTATVHRMQLTQVDPATHNGVARDGYVFEGWDRALSAVTGDVTVTARYRPIRYTIHYDANGGTGSLPDQTMTYDQSGRLRAHDGLTRDGYVFTGWNIKADGTGKAWDENQTVSNLLAHEDAVGTLYAQWERVPETSLPETGGTMGNHKLTKIIGGGVARSGPSTLGHATAPAPVEPSGKAV